VYVWLLFRDMLGSFEMYRAVLHKYIGHFGGHDIGICVCIRVVTLACRGKETERDCECERESENEAERERTPALACERACKLATVEGQEGGR